MLRHGKRQIKSNLTCMPWEEEKAVVPLQKASTKHTATQAKCNESDKTMKDALLLMLSRTSGV